MKNAVRQIFFSSLWKFVKKIFVFLCEKKGFCFSTLYLLDATSLWINSHFLFLSISRFQCMIMLGEYDGFDEQCDVMRWYYIYWKWKLRAKKLLHGLIIKGTGFWFVIFEKKKCTPQINFQFNSINSTFSPKSSMWSAHCSVFYVQFEKKKKRPNYNVNIVRQYH